MNTLTLYNFYYYTNFYHFTRTCSRGEWNFFFTSKTGMLDYASIYMDR
jgi:hypothetical protein